MTTSIRRLPRPVRKLIATIAVLVAAALAIGLSWLTHRPTGYSGNARVSSFISPDFASGFDVAWEATASDLGITGQIAATTTIDGVLIALARPEQTKGPSQPTNRETATSTAELIGIDASGKTPTVLWHHDLTKISGKLFVWEDSIVVGDQTIRASDGAVTATWKEPLPTELRSSYFSPSPEPGVLVGNPYALGQDSPFVRVMWPVVLTCEPAKSWGVSIPNDAEFSCQAWRKDGTVAWTYRTSGDDGRQHAPMNVPAANGYVYVAHPSLDDEQPGKSVWLIDGFMNLVDGSYVRGDLPESGLSESSILPTSEGWLTVRPSTTSKFAEDYVSLSPDGHQIAQTPRVYGSLTWKAFKTTTCWDPQSQVVTPTAQQAIETIHTGEVPWAAACIERTDTDVSDVKAINGQVLMVTTADGYPEPASYRRTSIVALDGSFLVAEARSGSPDGKDVKSARTMILYDAPSGVRLAALSDVGASSAIPLYDDLLIASPAHPDSWLARQRAYLGTYPHPDTVLMGITPKRAG